MKKRKNKIPLRVLIFLSIITTIIVTSLTLSKFESSVATTDGTRVAYPIIDFSTENSVISVPISPLIAENTYNFSISNKEGDKQSEVSIEYTIQIGSLENLPLEYELYTYNDGQLGTENLFSGNGKVSDKLELKIDDDIQTYQLKIKWREDKTSYLYSQTIDYIQVIVDSYQKD